MVYAGVKAGSFADASENLDEIGEVPISTGRIRRATERIGAERVHERDELVQQWQALSLPQQQASPTGDGPEVACVQMDGGRLQIFDRPADANEDSQPDGESGSAEQGAADGAKTHWRESKVGILLSLRSEVSASDPCPTIPPTFVDRKRVDRLAREIKNAGKKRSQASGPHAVAAQQEAAEFDATLEAVIEAKDAAVAEALRYRPPKIIEKTVVATRQDVTGFGPILAATAWRLGFAGAARKAFLGDGSETNWGVWRRHFSHYTPILDFVHAICYVYQAAMAGLPDEAAWETYCQWAQWVWSGQVDLVIDALEARLSKMDAPPRDAPDCHPYKTAATALGYLCNQQSRMKYDAYRKQGLPITSSHVESTIKQINRRVKGTEKFWNGLGAETLLQLVADAISEPKIMATFWKNRQAQADGQRHYQTAA
jgi:hypothetical protein